VDEFGGYVNLSNLFRFMLLYQVGGWWVDMDTVCLKPFDFEDDFVFSSEMTNPNNHCVVNNTYMKSAPHAKFLKDCIDFLSVRGHENIHWGELGITLLSRMILRNNMGRYIKPPMVFCPVPYFNLELLINETSCILPGSSYAIHWWNEIWRRNKIQKNGIFPQNSLYETMKQK
jgi:mannosyltransferase OCH1-like enzyme